MSRYFNSFVNAAGFCIVLLHMLCGFSGCGRDNMFVLARNSESPYVIVLTNEASPSEKHAAEELQHFIKLAAIVELPVVGEDEPRAKEPCRIFIGAGNLVNSGFKIQNSEFEDEGFIIRTIPCEDSTPDIVIAGARKRGTMFGVYTFLDLIGFRWYTNRFTWFKDQNGVCRVLDPETGNMNPVTLRVPDLDEKVFPAFIYRYPSITEARDVDWAARNRVNALLDDTRGGRVRIQCHHTFEWLIPRSLYKEHPKYFPMNN